MRLRVLVEAQEDASYDDLLAAATLAEQLGFDGFFTTDHYLPLGGRAPAAPPLDAWTTLAGLARETSVIRLGTLVTPATFRHPGSLAVIVAQVNAMSGGRAEVGLGAGWYEAEHRTFGLPFPDVVTRFDRLEGQLEFLHSFRAGAPVPPVILGGRGKPRTLRLAARWADEFNIEFPRPGVIARVRPLVREACAAAGRDPGTLAVSAAHLVCAGKSRSDFADRAGRAGLDPALDLGGLLGTVEEVQEKLAVIESQGVSRFYMQVPDFRDAEHLRQLASLI